MATDHQLTNLSIYLSQSRRLKLTELNIINCNLDTQALAETLRSLKNLEKLQKLSLVEMPKIFDKKSLRLLYRCCVKHPSLTHLNLMKNQIEYYEPLVELLKQTKNLQMLNISGNYMTEVVIQRFLSGLEENTSLVDLAYDKHRDVVIP